MTNFLLHVTIEKALILPSLKEVLTTVFHTADIIRKIPLSRSYVQRRIDEIVKNIQTNEALLSHVRFIKDREICEKEI